MRKEEKESIRRRLIIEVKAEIKTTTQREKQKAEIDKSHYLNWREALIKVTRKQSRGAISRDVKCRETSTAV